MRRFFFLLFIAAPAYADDNPNALDARTQQMADSLKPEARGHFITGYKAFNAKDFKTSSAEFETAYKLDPEVPLLFTWAQSERLGGNCPHAVELYQRYLYSDINKAQADFARHWIDACGGVVATKPPPPPPVVDAAPQPYVWYTDKPADALAIGGALVLAIGIGYFIDAKTTANATNAATVLEQHEQLRADTIHQRNVGIGATIAGTLIAGAGIGLYIYHSRSTVITADAKSVAVAIRW